VIARHRISAAHAKAADRVVRRVVSDWSDEETNEPLLADHRNFHKVEQRTKDGQRIARMLWVSIFVSPKSAPVLTDEPLCLTTRCRFTRSFQLSLAGPKRTCRTRRPTPLVTQVRRRRYLVAFEGEADIAGHC
jgi:hypothetical protein